MTKYLEFLKVPAADTAVQERGCSKDIPPARNGMRGSSGMGVENMHSPRALSPVNNAKPAGLIAFS
jgi:hypothetical protein